MAVGALCLIGGASLTLLSATSSQPGKSYVVFSGAILFGTLQLIYGAVKHFTEPEIIDPAENAPIDFKIMIRTLAACAEKTGGLNQHGIDVIRNILRHEHGKECDPQTVFDACRAVWGEADDLTSHLYHSSSKLTPDFRRTVVRAAAIFLAAGQSSAHEQSEFLLYISRACLLPDEEFPSNVATQNQLAVWALEYKRP